MHWRFDTLGGMAMGAIAGCMDTALGDARRRRSNIGIDRLAIDVIASMSEAISRRGLLATLRENVARATGNRRTE